MWDVSTLNILSLNYGELYLFQYNNNCVYFDKYFKIVPMKT